MANDIKLQESHPVDENLRPIKVGGKSTAIETAQHGNGARVNGNLEVTDSIPRVKTNLIESSNLVIDDAGDITLDSNSGAFIAKKAGTEFSSDDSAYAGMYLGYTRLANNSTGNFDNIIGLTGTMTVIETASGNPARVNFTAPPSGNVEIIFSCFLYSSSTTVAFALSDNASFSEIDETHTYDQGAYRMDETDYNTINISWAVTGLTSGTNYAYFVGAEEILGSTSTIYHGRFRSAGTHYPPIIIKAIALPSTILTGE